MTTISLVSNNKYPDSIKYKLWFSYSVLFLYAFNLMGMGGVIPLLVFPYVFNSVITTKFSKEFYISIILLSFFCIFYSIIISFYNYASITGIIGRIVYPPMFFVLGYKLVGESINYKKIVNLLLTIILGLTSYGFLSLMKTISLYGSMQNSINTFGGRNVIDLWGNGFISATALTAYLSFGLVLLPLLFIKGPNINKYKKYLMFVVFIASFYTIIQISSRTGLVIVFASIFIVAFFYVKISKSKVLNLILLLFFLFIGRSLYELNFFNVKLNVENTNLYQRIISTALENDSRVEAWKSTFFSLLDNPLGGKVVDLKVGYAHNLWLDVGYDAGIIPFILVITFTFSSMIAIYKFIDSDHPSQIKALIIAMLIAIFIVFMLEPVLQGLTIYFVFFCFLIGAIHKINTLYTAK